MRWSNETFALGLRVLVAALLGGLLGYERQRKHKVAGLRTHMLVALGSATFVAGTVASGGSSDDVARVGQGIAAGIGFIGAGAILKVAHGESVQGLTTAASIWMTSALGVCVGMGSFVIAIVAALAAWLILGVLARFEHHSPTGGP